MQCDPERKRAIVSSAINDSVTPRERRFGDVVAYLIFFLSGAAGLIYEISWSRQIGLLFGHTVHSAAIVLGSYFAGMSVGYLIGARLAPRVSPLLGYGIAEFIVAGWACLIPFLLGLAETTAFAGQLSGSSLALQTALRATFCFSLLLPATIALGTTLPLMAEFLSPKHNLSAVRVSLAYAVNTTGALLGVILATLYLLVVVGVQASSFVAAGLSALCGLAACILSRRVSWKSETEAVQKESSLTRTKPSDHHRRLWLAVVTLSGFGTLALEVLYTRLFSLVFHNSTYTFGAVIAVSLLALALGAMLASLVLQRYSVETTAIISSSLGAIAVAVSVILFANLTRFEYFASGDTFASYIRGASALVTFVVLPPMMLLGMILPTAWKALERTDSGSGNVVGSLTAVNTLAAAVGSLSAGFLLLPGFGLWGSFGFQMFLIYLISAGLLFKQNRKRFAFAGGLVLTLLLIVAIVTPQRLEQSSTDPHEELVRRWDSPYGWIDVVRNRESGALKVRQNLHYRFGATGADSTREYRQAHLPLLLHTAPQDVLFVGLGTGLTAGAAIAHGEVEKITVVELIPEVVEAARLLSEFNYNIVDHPKTEIQIDDARHYLLRTDRRFDVIVADLFVPWESQTGYLYTVEHYELTRKRLKPDGLFCQWLPLYQMGAREFELIADSFATVFPHTSLCWGRLDSQRAILALIGSNHPIKIDENRLDSRIAALNRASKRRDPYIGSGSHVTHLLLGGWSIRSPDWLNTDEHPRVEFLAPISHRDEITLNGQVLRDYFDSVLAGLPPDSAQYISDRGPPGMDLKQRRSWHRLILFGETNP